ncbi:MAG: TlyA family RNA methyltransferase [Oscillospiraceae bacterium]|jgi:23S rRNA (cytidine1920-2'-O)/16S rRNA (cytidine1409-2'-O)-methyltransferase|nr:TlyA family RNA methyltransferase [Oscillospiraceae bacterium]
MKKRLDVLVFERGFEISRERAKTLIMAGFIYVENQKSDKPGEFFPEDALVECRGSPLKYVSRGGLKLEKGLEFFGIELAGRTCMDVGCSTGGFTDCALQNGAKKVLAIDVGYGQFDWRLRNDPRVFLLEKTNVRYLKAGDVSGFDIDFVMIDVSFISLTKVISPIRELVNKNCEFLCLIKPQFEARKGEVGKNGIIRDEKLRMEVVGRVLDFLRAAGFYVCGLTASPIAGAKGNLEYLTCFEQSL